MRNAHTHLILIGGQRCGTTWLHQILADHPHVEPAAVVSPEPKFFLQNNRHSVYDQLFVNHHRRILLDKSTTYLERSDAALRARQCIPDATVAVILRDPVQRALSNWRFSTQHGLETLPASEALTTSAEHRPWDHQSTSPFHYLKRGHYVELLKPWLAAFGSQVKIFQYERLIQASPQDLAKALTTLGLEQFSEWPGPQPAVNSSTPVGDDTFAVEVRLANYFRAKSLPLARVGIDLTMWS